MAQVMYKLMKVLMQEILLQSTFYYILTHWNSTNVKIDPLKNG